MEITLRQALKLVEFFGGADTSVTVAPQLEGVPRDQHPTGLYAWCTEYPEEGSIYLGPTEVDDTLVGTPPADGEPAPTAPADGKRMYAVLNEGGHEGVVFDIKADAQWTAKGGHHPLGGIQGVPALGEAFREVYDGGAGKVVEVVVLEQPS